MQISRMIWAWQRSRYLRNGWWIDGGMWPRLRVVRDSTLDDYIYGPLAPTRPMGLAALLASEDAAK